MAPGRLDLINSCGTLVKKINSVIDKAKKHDADPVDMDYVDDSNGKLELWSVEYNDLHNRILPLCADAGEVTVQDDAALAFEDQAQKTRILLRQIQRKLAPTQPIVPATNTNKLDIRMPRLEMPTFSGNILDWTSFQDLFMASVGNSTSYTECQKLQYLVQAVQGPAAELIKSLKLTDANYQVAWDLLTKRYDNKRLTINANMDQLYELKPATSTKGLRHLLDTSRKQFRVLKGLGADNWNAFQVHLVSSRMDPESRRLWSVHKPGTDYPTFADLDQYLEERCQSLEEGGDLDIGKQKLEPRFQHPQRNMGRQGGSRGVHAATLGTTKMPYKPSFSSSQACTVCNSAHPVFRCPELQKMDIAGRRDTVRAKHLCYNCLRTGHSVAACTSASTCQKCNGKHHTLLHQEVHSTANHADKPSAKVNHLSSNQDTSAIMPTALVNVRDAFGQLRPCRVLLDSGSQISLVTEGFAKTLGHKIRKTSMPIMGIGETKSGSSKGTVMLEILSRLFNFSLQAMLYVMPKLTGEMPGSPVFGADSWPHKKWKDLADPNFFTPGKIDVILGIDLYDSVLAHGPGTFRRFKNKPSLRKSHFGWLVRGPVHTHPVIQTSPLSQAATSKASSCNVVIAQDVQEQLAKFWEMEELSSAPILSPEELQCENHFVTTHEREKDGRYVVSLPFKESSPCLGSSKEFAIRRLHQIERRLSKSEEYRAAYNRFMEEYLSLGHMEEIIEPETQSQEGIFYLPHHYVLKESSTSTKLRVVFDGSAKSSSGASLNDTLLVGPRLQNEIFDVLLRFRQYRYVFIADIEKFFRQVLIAEADRNYQRILWRSSQKEPVKEYRLRTYGTGPAPFLASRALNQLAEDEGETFPKAKPVILRDFYVDDCMSGEHDLQTALDLQTQLTAALASGGFPLVKWTSNCTEILEAVPPSQRETQIPIPMDKEDSVKALGLYWNPGADAFFFKVNLPPVSGMVSKRTILSDTAKLYDPLGWLSPGIFKAKILLQSLWKLNLGWDEPLPSDVETEWLQFRHQLKSLEEVKIHRHAINNINSRHQLHGFCDASEVGYAAAVYLRSQDDDGTVKISLLCSKTKVAPLKTVSIPRLELCSSTILARLISKVQKTLTIPIEASFAWTDSMDVLAWLKRSPHLWKTFVANRVSEIQTLTSTVTWGHVPGKENPADCASRGISPSELLNHELWWTGPPWLRLDCSHWPSFKNEDLPTEPSEQRPVKVFTTTPVRDPDLMSTCSTLGKLQRVTAYCFRFIRNSRIPGYRSKMSKQPQLEPLTRDELRLGLEHWVKIVQRQEFSRLFIAQSEAKDVPAPFSALMPFVDNHGLLRVGGRLSASGLSFGRRHPLLLPQSHRLTELIVEDAHRSTLHGPLQLMSVYLQKQYWIINMKRIVSRRAYKCITCTRHRADTMQQRMADLPGDRVRQSRPFLTTGVDYGGPFLVKSWKGRGAKRYKSYIALFVCLATRAIHIELVSDLTTECFLAALRRFIARRGKPAKMRSDNGTNFVGANNELKDLTRFVDSPAFNVATTDFCASEGIQWTFIPPKAPHHGGLWEAGIKSAKSHMKKVIGNNVLTFEELTTVLHQIEACLNSRPLVPLSTDPNDLEALTPSHFLIGDVLLAAADPDLTHLPENRLSRWQLVQQTSQRFWKRWRNEYLTELQRRSKWTKEEEEVTVGDLVLVKEDGLPPLQWARGRVIAVHPGPDGKIRVMDLKMSTGNGFQTMTLQRDVRKICKFPIEVNC